MESPSLYQYTTSHDNLKNSFQELEGRVTQIETLQKITEDLHKLQQNEETLLIARTRLGLDDLESRVQNIEEKEAQKLLELNHKCELHTILLEQSQDIEYLRNDLDELGDNIAHDDRLNNLENKWQEKLKSMSDSLGRIARNIESIKIIPLFQEVQYLHREIADDNIKKEQEMFRLELIQENIEKIWQRCDNFMPASQELEMEQELFLQTLEGKKS